MIAFLHIPKTGGTTAREVLLHALGNPPCLNLQFHSDLAFYSDEELSRFEMISGHVGVALLRRLSRPRCVFTFLREPVARTVSQYQYLQRLGKQSDGASYPPYQAWFAKHGLEELLEGGGDLVTSLFDNPQTWSLVSDYWYSLRPKLSDADALELATANLARLDFAGLAEQMEASLDYLVRRLGGVRRDPVPVLNATEAALDPLPAPLQKKIEEFTRLDRELYARARDLFETRLAQQHKRAERPGRAEERPLDSLAVPHLGWLSVEPDDEVATLVRRGYYEATEQAFFWNYLRPADTVVDCGAHVGLYTLLAARATNGHGRIVALEPHPETALLLAANVTESRAGGVRILRQALSSRAGTARLSVEPAGLSSHSAICRSDDTTGLQITTVTLDELLASEQLQELNLLKIDAEGHELEILRGAEAALKSGRVHVVMIEFSESNLQAAGATSVELARRLKGYELTLCRYEPTRNVLEPVEVKEPIWYANLFAVKNVAAVNQRLATAGAIRQRIARDIVKRAEACQLFKELEELKRYKESAANTDAFRDWAERTERLLAEERQRAEGFLRWAEQAEQQSAAHASRALEFEAWARKAEERLSASQQLAEEAQAWARKTEASLAAEKTRAQEFERWAQNTESRLAALTHLADSNRQWAERADLRAKDANERAESNRVWAEKTETRAQAAAQLAEANRAWAERADLRAKDANERAESNRVWAEKTETRAQAAAQLAEANRVWAEQAEARSRETALLAEANRTWAEAAEARLASLQQTAQEFEDWARRSDRLLAEEQTRSAELLAWARQTEGKLAAETAAKEEFRRWAKLSEERMEEQRELAAAHEQWALRTEQLLAAERETCRNNLAWAQNVERLLQEERSANRRDAVT